MAANYSGNKGFSNVLPLLVNHVPKSDRYFSLFFGSGGLETSDYMNSAIFICAEPNPICKKYTSMTAAIKYKYYQDLIEDNVFTANDFIYIDPPYMFSTRRYQKPLYKFEFSDSDHLKLLSSIRDLKAKILISHPICELYIDKLASFSSFSFQYMSHKGVNTDTIWYNYDIDNLPLVSYACLGDNFTDRQRIKRKRNNFINKLNNLTYHEQMAIIEEINKIF